MGAEIWLWDAAHTTWVKAQTDASGYLSVNAQVVANPSNLDRKITDAVADIRGGGVGAKTLADIQTDTAKLDRKITDAIADLRGATPKTLADVLSGIVGTGPKTLTDLYGVLAPGGGGFLTVNINGNPSNLDEKISDAVADIRGGTPKTLADIETDTAKLDEKISDLRKALMNVTTPKDNLDIWNALSALRWGDGHGEPSWVSGLNYAASTISFDLATKKILDSANGLAKFATGQTIYVTGSLHNNGTFTIATGGVAAEIVVNEAITDELVGAAVAIKQTVYVAPAAGVAFCDVTIGAGKVGEIFGFQITADEANSFDIRAGTYSMEHQALSALGTIFIVSPLPLEPAYGAGVLYRITNVNVATAGITYQGRILYREH